MNRRIFFLSFTFVTSIFTNDQYLLNTLQAIAPLPEQLVQGATLVDQAKQASTLVVPHDACPLFEAYPDLQQAIAHITLIDLPTPIRKLDRAGEFTGHKNLYVKQDNLCGFVQAQGVRNYGGNKPRKLEFLLADAVAHGAKTVLTWGCVASNHALATAWYAKKLGLECILMLRSQPNSYVVQKNLKLMHAMGAQMYFCLDKPMRAVGTAYACVRNKLDKGDFPYCIPTGGSVPLGAVGFVNAAFELKKQIQAGVMPEPDYIFVPCGSYGTTSGLLLGLHAAGLKSTLIPVCTEPVNKSECINDVIKLANETAALLHQADEKFPLYCFQPQDIDPVVEYAGEDYGQFSPEGVAAIKLMKNLEDITLDGTYTGKACAGMFAKLQTLPKEANILFWNTYCAEEYRELVATVATEDLPVVLQRYFMEPVQALDA
jgi:1-aminocyclopropane-1-carboxylate deaminase/D-cysteine desulfhydrase-like pyridoxal-dependent ACC family enzyme